MKSSIIGKIAFVSFLILIMTGGRAYLEVRYMAAGKTASAVIQKVVRSETHRTRSRSYGRRRVVFDVVYSFKNKNSGRTVNGYTTVSRRAKGKYPVGREVDVQYFGGTSFCSRLAETGSPLWLVLFLGGFFVFVGSSVYTVKQWDRKA